MYTFEFKCMNLSYLYAYIFAELVINKYSRKPGVFTAYKTEHVEFILDFIVAYVLFHHQLKVSTLLKFMRREMMIYDRESLEWKEHVSIGTSF
jgi:hypothetical protein